MAFRTFKDRNGHGWEVRNRALREWEFYPLTNNPNAARRVTSPGYEKDPFELKNVAKRPANDAIVQDLRARLAVLCIPPPPGYSL